MALWNGSNEDLWETGCLLAEQGGLERGRCKREDGREAGKAESDAWDEDGEMGKDRDEMQRDRKMDERKEGRGDLLEERPITSGWPCRPDACHSSALLLWHCIMHTLDTEWNAVSLVVCRCKLGLHFRTLNSYTMIRGHALCSLHKTELLYLHFGPKPSGQQFI